MTKNGPYSLPATILSNIQIGGDDIFLLELSIPNIAQAARPGQFVMLDVGDGNSHDPLLRRPFSIHKVTENNISVLYRIAGRGTNKLASRTEGESVAVVGPLGVGFKLKKGHHCLIGGGIGVAPLLYLMESLINDNNQKPETITLLLGAQSDSSLVCLDKFKDAGINVNVATDDGSTGHHGFVTDLLISYITGQASKDINIYSCGPEPMLKAVAVISKQYNLSCQVSVESLMACGMGACLGCVHQAKSRDNKKENSYIHVCKDGPVLEAERIW